MTNPLSGLKIEHWWHAFTILGGAGMIGALAIRSDCSLQRDPFFAFFGLFLFGVGQWINHPIKQTLISGGILTTHQRHAYPLGIVFEILGGIIFVVEAFRIIFAK